MSLFKRGLTPKAALLAAAVVVGGTMALVVSNSADAAGTDGGPATIVNPATSTPLTGGGSQTVWTLDLPASPADRCAGDSASQGFFAYSYLTPVANNPANLTFNPDEGPDQPGGSFAYPLFDTSNGAFVSENTAPTTGQVNPDQFNFNRFSLTGGSGKIALPAGSYNLGVACWNGNAGSQDRFWNTVVTFSAGSDPNGEVWVVGTPPPPTTTTVAPTTTTTVPPTTTTVPPTTTTVPPTTTTVPPTTTTTTGGPPPPPPCVPPDGLLSGPVYNLVPALLSVATTLCNLGL